MKAPMVLAVSSRALLDVCERRGLDIDELLALAGLDRAEVSDPNARLPGRKVRALWQAAYERAGDPDLALHAVEALPFGAYGVIDFLARTAGSIGEAFERIARYFPLINTVVHLPIEHTDGESAVGVAAPGDPAAVFRESVEYTLAAVFLRTRIAVGVDFPLARVDFAFAAPPETREHARIFGCPLRFRAPRSALVLDRRVWNTPLARGDTGLAAVLERHAAMLLAELPPVSDEISEVRAAIHAELKGGDPGLDHVARKLGVSRRSLQRRLAGAGLTYATVLDEVRASVARAYLAQEALTIAEIAYLLGFSDQSSFTRAFRRWTGNTPAELRASTR